MILKISTLFCNVDLDICITLYSIDSNILTRLEPTNPLDPDIETIFIKYPLEYYNLN